MAFSEWSPLLAAVVAGGLSLIGVWWSIRSTNNREQERWRNNKVTESVADLLAKSQQTTEAIDLYVHAHNRIAKDLPDAHSEVPTSPADRFETLRRYSTLKSSLALVQLVASPEVYRAALAVVSEHSRLLGMMRACDSAYSDQFDGWGSREDTPRTIIKSFVKGIAGTQGGVELAERSFSQVVRRELGIRELELPITRTVTYSAASSGGPHG